MRQSDDSARAGAVISQKRSKRALALPQRQNGPGQQVSRNDNAHTPDEGTGDTTYAFPAHLLRPPKVLNPAFRPWKARRAARPCYS
jgi:hypothetical protein